MDYQKLVDAIKKIWPEDITWKVLSEAMSLDEFIALIIKITIDKTFAGFHEELMKTVEGVDKLENTIINLEAQLKLGGIKQ